MDKPAHILNKTVSESRRGALEREDKSIGWVRGDNPQRTAGLIGGQILQPDGLKPFLGLLSLADPLASSRGLARSVNRGRPAIGQGRSPAMSEATSPRPPGTWKGAASTGADEESESRRRRPPDVASNMSPTIATPTLARGSSPRRAREVSWRCRSRPARSVSSATALAECAWAVRALAGPSSVLWSRLSITPAVTPPQGDRPRQCGRTSGRVRDRHDSGLLGVGHRFFAPLTLTCPQRKVTS